MVLYATLQHTYHPIRSKSPGISAISGKPIDQKDRRYFQEYNGWRDKDAADAMLM